ncbi:hypothetical protein [Umezawaea beigongshangensis]|uniref:hypothetical protein n=1 Tax=Umezawaea beigongshangensis TaxID=2780383 RepID=UPI0018F110C8|nr:hypothetical protein [Umezawaea beigongshangensis]
MPAPDPLAWAGIAVGVLGLIAAYLQTLRARVALRARQALLRHVVDRANHLALDRDEVARLAAGTDADVARHLWLSHQAAADLYALAVDDFLSGEKRFTYADLDKIAATPLVGGERQFRYWVSQVALRPENRRTAPPAPPVPARPAEPVAEAKPPAPAVKVPAPKPQPKQAGRAAVGRAPAE